MNKKNKWFLVCFITSFITIASQFCYGVDDDSRDSHYTAGIGFNPIRIKLPIAQGGGNAVMTFNVKPAEWGASFFEADKKPDFAPAVRINKIEKIKNADGSDTGYDQVVIEVSNYAEEENFVLIGMDADRIFDGGAVLFDKFNLVVGDCHKNLILREGEACEYKFAGKLIDSKDFNRDVYIEIKFREEGDRDTTNKVRPWSAIVVSPTVLDLSSNNEITLKNTYPTSTGIFKVQLLPHSSADSNSNALTFFNFENKDNGIELRTKNDESCNLLKSGEECIYSLPSQRSQEDCAIVVSYKNSNIDIFGYVQDYVLRDSGNVSGQVGVSWGVGPEVSADSSMEAAVEGTDDFDAGGSEEFSEDDKESVVPPGSGGGENVVEEEFDGGQTQERDAQADDNRAKDANSSDWNMVYIKVGGATLVVSGLAVLAKGISTAAQYTQQRNGRWVMKGQQGFAAAPGTLIYIIYKVFVRR